MCLETNGVSLILRKSGGYLIVCSFDEITINQWSKGCYMVSYTTLGANRRALLADMHGKMCSAHNIFAPLICLWSIIWVWILCRKFITQILKFSLLSALICFLSVCLNHIWNHVQSLQNNLETRCKERQPSIVGWFWTVILVYKIWPVIGVVAAHSSQEHTVVSCLLSAKFGQILCF